MADAFDKFEGSAGMEEVVAATNAVKDGVRNKTVIQLRSISGIFLVNVEGSKIVFNLGQ